jgi:TolB-like protein
MIDDHGANGMRLLIVAALACALAQAQPAPAPKPNVAVTDLAAEGLPASEARIITDRLRSELLNTGAFTVVERGQMEEVLKEQGFQQSGCVSDQCAVEVGQLLGVSHIVAGSLGRVGKTITMNVRLVEVATGKIAHAVNIDCQCEVEQVLQSSCRQVARELAVKMGATLAPEAAPAAKPNRRGRIVRRIVFGSLAAVALGAGLWANGEVSSLMSENADIKAAYDAAPNNANYLQYRADYQANWDEAHNWSIVRDVLYGASGLCGVGLVISIPF